ncbi:MAG: HEAT repeat domain-containing protein [Myxococcota bacterium]
MARIRPEDRRDLVLGFVTLMTMMAAHALVETARDTLFLTNLDAEKLPWAYLSIAALSLVTVKANQMVLARTRDKRTLLAISLAFGGVGHAVFFQLLGGAREPLLFAFYVWTGHLATILVVQFWLLLDDVVTVTEAKRIFGPVAAGGVVGATLGSLAAARLLDVGASPRSLVLVAAGVLLAGAALPRLWKRGEAAEAERASAPRGAMTTLFRHVYLRRLLLLVLISTFALTGGDYLFKAVVERSIPPEGLGPFFARFYAGLNAAALVVQLVLSGWLLRTLGVNRALVVLPAVLLTAATSFALAPALLPVLLLKGADGSLKHSLHRTSMEVLYLPLPKRLRDRYKAVIDVIGQRGGQALVSLVLLGAVHFGGVGPRETAIAVAVLLVAWLLVLYGLKEPYLQLFRRSLRGGLVDRPGLAELDLHSFETLLGTLNSEHDEEVLVAIELFERYGRVELLPKLILHHPSCQVVIRALDAFVDAGDPSFVPTAKRLLGHESPLIRAAALRAMTSVVPDAELLEKALHEDQAPEVKTTALVGLLAAQLGDEALLRGMIQQCIAGDPKPVQLALAQAIRQRMSPIFEGEVAALLTNEDPDILREAALAAAVQPSPTFIEPLLLLTGNGLVRGAARQALVAQGAPALTRLTEAMGDASLSRKVRRHIPRTIARFDPRDAARILQARIPYEWDGAVRYKLLRAIGSLVKRHRVTVDRTLFEARLRTTLERIVRLLELRVALESSRPAGVPEDAPAHECLGHELLVATLREKEINAFERAFRILAILDPSERYGDIWRGLRTGEPKAHAASRELLENALRGVTREAVLALAEDRRDAERLAAAAAALRLSTTPHTYEQALGKLVSDASESVRSLAAYHVAELGLTGLEDTLAGREEKSTAVSEVLENALRSLRRSEVPSVA